MAISRAQMKQEVSTGGRKMKKKLKKVDKKKNPGLAKLPTKVRNKMGYMKKGGRVKQMCEGCDKLCIKCESMVEQCVKCGCICHCEETCMCECAGCEHEEKQDG